ncbi:undecaprenyl-phosphate glucose phosphotransferase [Tamilnaduibacter salinus]|uniref:Undecaprenyl-phosphate glucose phosphotransferase n=1 Tax=Tamilnaduibacter salinus TaxID=1484056 RepID=A0A2A2I0C7_9GAMM|nr:undecaprenyl-phosphate glucose phosphotransferase [Tamilnaduibacter salinus]PAV25471.1 undecaprenyl-phosphate glucose phosphotransferase [Tamilnaduibacter salinus]
MIGAPRLDRDYRIAVLGRLTDIAVLLITADLVFLAKFHHLVLKPQYEILLLVAVLFMFLAFPAIKVYDEVRGQARRFIVARLFNGYVFLGVFLVVVLFMSKTSEEFSRVWLFSWLIASFLGSVLIRAVSAPVIDRERREGRHSRTVTLLGTQRACIEVEQKLKEADSSGYVVYEQYLLDDESPDTSFLLSGERPERSSALFSTDEVWICVPLRHGGVVTDVLNQLTDYAGDIRYIPDLSGIELLNHGVVNIAGMFALDVSCSPIRGTNYLVKSLEDYVLSTGILILISPLMLLIALGVKVSSPGPVFYRQERAGWSGKPFSILKFRSMAVGADQSGLRWGRAGDKGITRFGAFLRKTSLDELPQFINVLKGDMSIVGPRPERVQFVDEFKEHIPGYMRKHLVKAGITGWAQVNGWRGDTSLHERIEHDLYYIDNWSLWFDFKIIIMTVLGAFFDGKPNMGRMSGR